MRCLPYFFIVLSLVGCRSQGTPTTNPFLAPDRVPPPATRTLLPGTAQPYYPGDPVPGAATGPVTPAPTYAAPPAGQPVYTPEPAPVTPSTNPWGQPMPGATSYNMQSSSVIAPVSNEFVDGQVVSVAPDNQNLRFSSAAAPSQDIVQVAAQQQLAQNSYQYTPPQVLPTGGTPLGSGNTSPTGAFVPPVLPQQGFQDGFRPQGSSHANTESNVDRPTTATVANSTSSRYGYDAAYTWLRGQLQYFPQTGVWGLRYLDPQSPPDQMGGVVVIDNPEVLGGVQPGEFLFVQGYFEAEDNGDGTFTPYYTISGIQRQQ